MTGGDSGSPKRENAPGIFVVSSDINVTTIG
jgi:hypothetical protein